MERGIHYRKFIENMGREYTEDDACRGILPMIIAAKQANVKTLIIPTGNLSGAQFVQEIDVRGFECLDEVIHYLEGKQTGIVSTEIQVFKTENTKMIK